MFSFFHYWNRFISSITFFYKIISKINHEKIYSCLFQGVFEEIEKPEGVYFDMSEDKHYVNLTRNNVANNVSNRRNVNNATRLHARSNESDMIASQVQIFLNSWVQISPFQITT